MKSRWWPALLVALAVWRVTAARPVMACWARPPDEVWSLAPSGEHALRLDNLAGIAGIWRVGEPPKLLWKTSLADFRPIFSKVLASPDGATIIHLRGNHIVNSTADTAVETFRSNGTQHSFAASDFVRDLAVCRQRVSVSPRYMWLGDIGEVTDTTVAFETVWGKRVTVEFESGDITLAKGAERASLLDAKSWHWLHLRMSLPLLIIGGAAAALVFRLRRIRREYPERFVRRIRLLKRLAVVIPAAVVVLAFFLWIGSPQWGRAFYIFQNYVCRWGRHGSLKAPDDYTGVWREWHPNGRMKSERRYLNGEPDGRLISWHDNGMKAGESTYVQGAPVGAAVLWRRDGRKSREYDYGDGGRSRQILYHPNGRKSYEDNRLDLKRHGRHALWDEAGYCWQDCEYEDGAPRRGIVIAGDTEDNGRQAAFIYREGLGTKNPKGSCPFPLPTR